MSLRLRLTLILGSAFILLWSLAAAWMLCDLRGQMMRSFDQRLAASARMVAGLHGEAAPQHAVDFLVAEAAGGAVQRPLRGGMALRQDFAAQ